MKDGLERAGFDPSAEAEWSHATALGEAVWARMAASQKRESKDPALAAMHDRVVGFVRDAAFVLERDGFEGVADWLDAEELIET